MSVKTSGFDTHTERGKLADFDEQRKGRSNACYMLADVRGQVVKVSLNGRVPEVT